ncbi:unnamed protein product, partial [Amoebophrya sp. A120]
VKTTIKTPIPIDPEELAEDPNKIHKLTFTTSTSLRLNFQFLIKARTRMQWQRRYSKEYKWDMDVLKQQIEKLTLGDIQREAANEGVPNLLSVESSTKGKWWIQLKDPKALQILAIIDPNGVRNLNADYEDRHSRLF